MKKRWHVTYGIVSPESAETGDTTEDGFVTARGVHVPVQPQTHWDDWRRIKAECALTLREALELIGLVEDSGNWWTEVDGSHHYGTGDHTTQSLHPPENITEASYARVSRLIHSF